MEFSNSKPHDCITFSNSKKIDDTSTTDGIGLSPTREPGHHLVGDGIKPRLAGASLAILGYLAADSSYTKLCMHVVAMVRAGCGL
jgi:hypothetical protein